MEAVLAEKVVLALEYKKVLTLFVAALGDGEFSSVFVTLDLEVALSREDVGESTIAGFVALYLDAAFVGLNALAGEAVKMALDGEVKFVGESVEVMIDEKVE